MIGKIKITSVISFEHTNWIYCNVKKITGGKLDIDTMCKFCDEDFSDIPGYYKCLMFDNQRLIYKGEYVNRCAKCIMMSAPIGKKAQKNPPTVLALLVTVKNEIFFMKNKILKTILLYLKKIKKSSKIYKNF